MRSFIRSKITFIFPISSLMLENDGAKLLPCGNKNRKYFLEMKERIVDNSVFLIDTLYRAFLSNLRLIDGFLDKMFLFSYYKGEIFKRKKSTVIYLNKKGQDFIEKDIVL